MQPTADFLERGEEQEEHGDEHRYGLYSSVAERQSCKLKVMGSIPSGGCAHVPITSNYARRCISFHRGVLSGQPGSGLPAAPTQQFGEMGGTLFGNVFHGHVVQWRGKKITPF